jgi:hypothetical protein
MGTHSLWCNLSHRGSHPVCSTCNNCISDILGHQWLLITGGILFERSGYRSQVNRTLGKWQPTGERFNDPTTGQVVEVYYNPQTGERDYRESSHQD